MGRKREGNIVHISVTNVQYFRFIVAALYFGEFCRPENYCNETSCGVSKTNKQTAFLDGLLQNWYIWKAKNVYTSVHEL